MTLEQFAIAYSSKVVEFMIYWQTETNINPEDFDSSRYSEEDWLEQFTVWLENQS